MDFANAMHLAASTDCQAFATFDRKLTAAAARKVGAAAVSQLQRCKVIRKNSLITYNH